MRVYLDEKEKELVTVICNQCKKELLVENGILKEECIHVTPLVSRDMLKIRRGAS